MANITQVEVNGTTYDICDATARDSISSLQNFVSSVNTKVNERLPKGGRPSAASQGKTAAQILESVTDDGVFWYWAHSDSQSYSPTGSSGEFCYVIIDFYEGRPAYRHFFAFNADGRVGHYSLSSGSWKQL